MEGCCVSRLNSDRDLNSELVSFTFPFLQRREIMAMGFGPKFIRMWQYYFVYCAVGFKTRTLGDLQVRANKPRPAPLIQHCTPDTALYS